MEKDTGMHKVILTTIDGELLYMHDFTDEPLFDHFLAIMKEGYINYPPHSINNIEFVKLKDNQNETINI